MEILAKQIHQTKFCRFSCAGFFLPYLLERFLKVRIWNHQFESMYETKFRAETYHSVMTNLQSFNNSFKFSWASVTGVNYLFLTFSLNKCEIWNESFMDE